MGRYDGVGSKRALGGWGGERGLVLRGVRGLGRLEWVGSKGGERVGGKGG